MVHPNGVGLDWNFTHLKSLIIEIKVPQKQKAAIITTTFCRPGIPNPEITNSKRLPASQLFLDKVSIDTLYYE